MAPAAGYADGRTASRQSGLGDSLATGCALNAFPSTPSQLITRSAEYACHPSQMPETSSSCRGATPVAKASLSSKRRIAAVPIQISASGCTIHVVAVTSLADPASLAGPLTNKHGGSDSSMEKTQSCIGTTATRIDSPALTSDNGALVSSLTCE